MCFEHLPDAALPASRESPVDPRNDPADEGLPRCQVPLSIFDYQARDQRIVARIATEDSGRSLIGVYLPPPDASTIVGRASSMRSRMAGLTTPLGTRYDCSGHPAASQFSSCEPNANAPWSNPSVGCASG